MAPYELRNLTVSQLGKIRNSMLSAEYMWETKKLPPEKQQESGLLLHKVQMAFFEIRKAELVDIRDQLVTLEPELTNGMNAVQQVLTDLKKVEDILAVVSSFLDITTKILALL